MRTLAINELMGTIAAANWRQIAQANHKNPIKMFAINPKLNVDLVTRLCGK